MRAFTDNSHHRKLYHERVIIELSWQGFLWCEFKFILGFVQVLLHYLSPPVLRHLSITLSFQPFIEIQKRVAVGPRWRSNMVAESYVIIAKAIWSRAWLQQLIKPMMAKSGRKEMSHHWWKRYSGVGIRPPSVPFWFVPQEFHTQAGLASWDACRFALG